MAKGRSRLFNAGGAAGVKKGQPGIGRLHQNIAGPGIERGFQEIFCAIQELK
jgi:hypothetical protein